jgi:hypothetical protein
MTDKKKPRLTCPAAAEISAISAAYDALSELDYSAAKRALAWLSERLVSDYREREYEQMGEVPF